MVETIILLKPQAEWREDKTKNDIITEINNKLQIPGVTNGFNNLSSTASICFRQELEPMWE